MSALTNLVITLFRIQGVTRYTEETRRNAQNPRRPLQLLDLSPGKNPCPLTDTRSVGNSAARKAVNALGKLTHGSVFSTRGARVLFVADVVIDVHVILAWWAEEPPMPVLGTHRQVAGAVSWHKRPNVLPGKAIGLCRPGWVPDSLTNDGWILISDGWLRPVAGSPDGEVPHCGPAEGVITHGNLNECRRNYHHAHAR